LNILIFRFESTTFRNPQSQQIMIERSFGLIFFLKQSKDAHKNDRTVYTRITVNKKSKDISLMYPWSIERWDIKLGRAMGTKADAKELNAFLETIRFKVLEGRRTLMESNTEITAENLKNILLGQTDENRKLLKVFEDHNQRPLQKNCLEKDVRFLGFFHAIFRFSLSEINRIIAKRLFSSLLELLFCCYYWFGRNYPRRPVQVVGNRLHQILGMHF